MRKTVPFLASALAFLYWLPSASAGWGFPEALTPRGQRIQGVYEQIAIAAVIVFVFVMALLLWVIVRYREGSGHGRATYEASRHSTKLEVTWTVIPLLIMLWIGVISYFALVDLDEDVHPDDADFELQIVGSRYNWEAVYPFNAEAQYPGSVRVNSAPDPSTGAVTDGNTFIVPAGQDIALNITAVDVIHAFYISDVNQGPVGLVDANPSGDHKYNYMVINFPEGEYYVQCREMCFNPGHAYMRARIKAVSEADYSLWLEERQAAVGAQVPSFQSFEYAGGPFTEGAGVTGVVGMRLIYTITNTGDSPLTVDADSGPDSLAPGQRGVFAVDLDRLGPRDITFTMGGQSHAIPVEVVEATPMTVDMGAFEYEPQDLQLERGVRYLITLNNVHDTAHNLFIGEYQGEVLFRSPTVAAGATGFMLVEVDESGTYDMWCNIPGHYESGMHGDVHVQA